MERVVAHLATHLSPRYRPLVICLTVKGHFAPMLEGAGVEVIALGKREGKDLGLPRRLARLLRDRGIRVMHAHNSGPMFTGVLAAKLAGVRCAVVTDHCRAYPERPTVAAAEFVLARLADELVSVSEDNKRDLIEQLRWPAAKIRVIHNGVAAVPELDEPAAQRLRAELGLEPPTPTVLTLARLEAQKNIPLLIDAAARLRRRGVGCRFLVAGDGAARPEIERAIAAHGLADSFTLLGWRLDAPALYRVADILALSSDWEGLPMCLLEAMSAGLPTAATDVGDVAKAIEHNRTGLLVPRGDADKLADALAALAVDAAKRRAFGAAAREVWQASFSVDHMVRRYEELYARYV
jgi:glycosyltransferase involved in cell wall biosynthesis